MGTILLRIVPIHFRKPKFPLHVRLRLFWPAFHSFRFYLAPGFPALLFKAEPFGCPFDKPVTFSDEVSFPFLPFAFLSSGLVRFRQFPGFPFFCRAVQLFRVSPSSLLPG